MGLLADRLRLRRRFVEPEAEEAHGEQSTRTGMFSAAMVAAAAAEDELEEDNEYQSDED